MEKMRQWTLLTVVAVLAVLAGGYFLLVQPKSDKAAEVRVSTEAQLAANTRLQGEINRLKKQAADLPRQQAKLAALSSRIPSNPALPTLIRTMTDAADRAGVELVSLAPGAPTLFTTPATTPVAGGAPAPGAGAPAEPLYAIPLTIAVNGGYVQMQQFFSNLEDLPRTIQVTAFSVGPFQDANSSISSGVTAALTTRVYMIAPAAVAPAPLAVPGAAPPPATTGAPAAAPSTTSQPTPAATPAQ